MFSWMRKGRTKEKECKEKDNAHWERQAPRCVVKAHSLHFWFLDYLEMAVVGASRLPGFVSHGVVSLKWKKKKMKKQKDHASRDDSWRILMLKWIVFTILNRLVFNMKGFMSQNFSFQMYISVRHLSVFWFLVWRSENELKELLSIVFLHAITRN